MKSVEIQGGSSDGTRLCDVRHGGATESPRSVAERSVRGGIGDVRHGRAQGLSRSVVVAPPVEVIDMSRAREQDHTRRGGRTLMPRTPIQRVEAGMSLRRQRVELRYHQPRCARKGRAGGGSMRGENRLSAITDDARRLPKSGRSSCLSAPRSALEWDG